MEGWFVLWKSYQLPPYIKYKILYRKKCFIVFDMDLNSNNLIRNLVRFPCLTARTHLLGVNGKNQLF